MPAPPAAPGPGPGSIADAIVVLGALVHPDGRPSAAIERRMRIAISLYQAGAAAVLVLSGGGSRPVPEAAVMRDLALAAGVPAAALMLEPRSRTTAENATESARLLDATGRRTIILVTDSCHALRASLLFRLSGIAVVAVRAARMPMRRRLSMAVAECAKLPVDLGLALLRRRRRPTR